MFEFITHVLEYIQGSGNQQNRVHSYCQPAILAKDYLKITGKRLLNTVSGTKSYIMNSYTI